MNEEQRRILEMLAGGKISAAEADALLQALEGNKTEAVAIEIDAGDKPSASNGAKRQVFAELSQDQLMEMSLHGVNSDYVREMRELGLGDLSPGQLVEMKIHGVKPSFVKEMRALGYDVKLGQVIEMSMHGINADYVRKMQEQGFDDLSVGKLVEMKIHGLNPELVSEMRSLR